jgi:anti-sigma B factor antagonist
MKIIKEYNEKELTVKIEENIDTVTAPDFENELTEEFGKFESLILDCEKLQYISSSGLRVLIMVQKKLQPQNIPFTIINCSSTIREILSMSGFDKILNIQ